MATPTLTRHTIPGALGEILIDVRASARRHPAPAVLVVHGFKGFKDWGMFPPFSERLARAGFAAVTPSLSGSGVDGDGRFALPDRFRRPRRCNPSASRWTSSMRSPTRKS